MSDSRLVEGFGKALRRTAQAHLRVMLNRPVRPIKLRLSLTNRCNARCVMCSVWKFQEPAIANQRMEIQPGEIRMLGERSRKFFSELRHISLTGGEATLRADLPEVFVAIGEAFPERSVSINSNGFSPARLLPLVDLALESLPALTVTISLDGIGDAHGRVRGMGPKVFDAVQRSILGIVERREAGKPVDVEINTVMTNMNADQMPAVAAFCAEHKLAWNPIYVVRGQLYLNADREGDALDLTPESRARLLEDMRAIAHQRPSVKNFETVRLLEENGRRDYDCWAGRLLLLIEENGEVYPNGGCPSGFRMGNIREFGYDLDALFATPLAQAVLKRAEECRNCAIPCEYMTTLRYAEAVAGWRKTRDARAFAGV